MKSFLLTILTLLFLLGCKETPLGLEENVREEYSEIIPLSLNNKWTYRVIEYDNNGSKINTFHLDTKVSNVHVLNNENWYRIENHPYRNFSSVLLSNRDNGQWLWLLDDYQTPVLDYKYAAHLNDQYEQPFFENLQSENNIRRTVTHTHSEITINDKKYVCKEYTDDILNDDGTLNKENISITYFTIDVGIVKRLEYEENQTGDRFLKREIELVNYNLK